MATTTPKGTERWWCQLVSGGAPSPPSRRYRPGRDTQQHLRSAKMFLNGFNVVRSVPDVKHQLLSDRSNNEAYLTRIEGEAYAIYFPDGGEVRLSVSQTAAYTLKCLDRLGTRLVAKVTSGVT